MAEVMHYDEGLRSLEEYIKIVKRRKVHLILPLVVVFALAVMITFALPARYTSQATILIEDQEVPREFVVSTITSFAAQRIQVISQRVLTAESIRGIAEKYDLYLDEESGKRLPSTLMAEQFRQDTTLELVSADVIDPRSGRPTEATIAFTLAFEHGNPSTAQNVTNELVTLFLDENLRTRTERAASTEEFLSAESESLNDELLRLEEELARFKEKNEGALPELYEFNLSTLERTSREIGDVDIRLKEIAKRQIELASELAQISPSAPVVLASGEAVLSDADRSKALRSEYRQKAATYRATHPDVRRLEREIAELESELGVHGATVQELSDSLREERSRLTDLRQRYEPGNAQIVTAERVVADLEAELAQARSSGGAVDLAPDNPAYVLLDTQRKAAVSEENALRARRRELQQKMTRLENNIARAPTVEQEYQALLRDYQNTEVKYQEVRAKQREAQVAENLESERKGERFVLVEPPDLPLAPSSPNRPALILVGLILAMGSGVGLAMLMEAMDKAIYGDVQLAAITGTPPFAVVPYIENSEDAVLANRSKRRWVIASALGFTVFVVYFHFFIKPLDVLWFMLLNKIGF